MKLRERGNRGGERIGEVEEGEKGNKERERGNRGRWE